MSDKTFEQYQIIENGYERFEKHSIKLLLKKLYSTEDKQTILGIERSKKRGEPVLITLLRDNNSPNNITLNLFNTFNDQISYIHLKRQSVELKQGEVMESQLWLENINVNADNRTGYGDLLINYTKMIAKKMGIDSIVGCIPEKYMENVLQAEKLYTFFEGNNLLVDLNNYFYLRLEEDIPKILEYTLEENNPEKRNYKRTLINSLNKIKRKLHSIAASR